MELRTFFSVSLTHKIINSVLLVFGLFTIYFVFGCLLFFYAYYKKNAKYFLEEYRFMIQSIIIVSIDSGVIPLISAVIHAFFLEDLRIQTVLLVLMELFWFWVRIKCALKGVFMCLGRTIIHLINNVLRIIFLVTLFCF